MRPPETVELKHGTRGVNVFLLSKLGCETFGSQLLYLWEITVNEVQFQVPHHSPTLALAPADCDSHSRVVEFLFGGKFCTIFDVQRIQEFWDRNI